MNNAIIYHHLGLGDHFICNGLVHTIAPQYNKVVVMCKQRLFKTINHLYSDFSNIHVHGIAEEPTDVYNYQNNTNFELIKIGFEQHNPMMFEKSFYDQMQVPQENQYTKFSFPTNLVNSEHFYHNVQMELGSEYIFVHDESTAGKYNLKIDSDLPRFTVQTSDTDDVLDYIHTIANAKEIHFINSGLFPLITIMFVQKQLRAEKIYFHAARKMSEGGIPIMIPDTFIPVLYE